MRRHAGDRRDGHHRAATGPGDGGAGVLEGQERAREVGGQDAVPLVERGRQQRARAHRRRPRPRTGAGRAPPVATAVADRGAHLVLVGHVAHGEGHLGVSRGAPGASSSTDWRSRSSRRPARVTDAPSATRRRAHSSPMPVAPPVTSADRPASDSDGGESEAERKASRRRSWASNLAKRRRAALRRDPIHRTPIRAPRRDKLSAMPDDAAATDKIRLVIPAEPAYGRLARITVSGLALRLGFTFRAGRGSAPGRRRDRSSCCCAPRAAPARSRCLQRRPHRPGHRRHHDRRDDQYWVDQGALARFEAIVGDTVDSYAVDEQGHHVHLLKHYR